MRDGENTDHAGNAGFIHDRLQCHRLYRVRKADGAILTGDLTMSDVSKLSMETTVQLCASVEIRRQCQGRWAPILLSGPHPWAEQVASMLYYLDPAQCAYPGSRFEALTDRCSSCNGTGGCIKGNAPNYVKRHGGRPGDKWWRNCAECDGKGEHALRLLPCIQS